MKWTYGCCVALRLRGRRGSDQAAAQSFPPEQIKQGAQIYAANCATCHGDAHEEPAMGDRSRDFSARRRARFIDSVTNGVRNMPPWGDVIKPDGVAALWAYLVAGEK